MERNPVLHVVTSWFFGIVLVVVGCRLVKKNITKYLQGEALPRDTALFSILLVVGGLVSLMIAVVISFLAPRLSFW